MNPAAKFETLVSHLLDASRYDDAINACLKYLAGAPESIDARHLLIRAHLGKREYDKADQAATSVIAMAPDDPYGFFLKSITSHALKRFNSELEMAEQAAKLAPDVPYFLDRLARAQLQSGLRGKARNTVEQLIKLSPNDASAHELLGDICIESSDYTAAEKHYRAALHIDPGDMSALNDLARTLAAQEKWQEAIDIWFNALKNDPTSSVLQENTFAAIKRHLDKNTFNLKRKQTFEALPQPMQAFYLDFKNRVSVFERFSNLSMTSVWASMFIIIAIASMYFSK